MKRPQEQIERSDNRLPISETSPKPLKQTVKRCREMNGRY